MNSKNIDKDYCYILDIREFPDIPDTGELMDILMDEYRLDSEFDDRYRLKVYAYSDSQLSKLENMMQDYGASDNYIDNVINGINENKNIKFNMRHGINNCRRDLVLRKKDGCGCGRRMNESHGSKFNRGYSRRADILNEWEREYDVVDNSDLDDMLSLFESADKNACKCRYKGKMISKMDKAAKRDAKAEVREEIKELKKQIKEVTKAGKSTKALEAKLEKLQNILDCLMGKCDSDVVNESISLRFARRGRLFESEEDDEPADDEPADDEPADDEPADNEPADNSDDNNEDEYEDVEMKAVVLTVLKKDIDKVKEELVEAGISEEHIDMPECDDKEDDDECEIRVDAEAVAELSEYLKTKGIDLEEEIGGEIVNDAEEDAVEDEVADQEDDDTSAEGDEEADFSDEDFDEIFK